MLFDTHIHLDLLTDLQQQVDLAKRHDIGQFLLPGVSPQDWPQMMQTAAAVSGVLVAPGVHPLAASEWNSETEEQLRVFLRSPESVAIGEIGLDRLAETSPERQEAVLREQLRIAIECELPVILHCRRATGRLLQILTEERADRVGGIFHAFTGSIETAREAVRLGFALGLGGQTTYPDRDRIAAMIRSLPAEWIVLETDAPDQAPHPHHGEANRPEWLCYVQQRLAALRGWSLDETAAITTSNARRVLHLQENL